MSASSGEMGAAAAAAAAAVGVSVEAVIEAIETAALVNAEAASITAEIKALVAAASAGGGKAVNSDLTMTSKSSDHVAKNSAPDVCFTPDKTATIPHGNDVNTSKATEHTTPKTQLHEAPVVRQGDAIGPPSNSGDGGACGKGVASGTCQQEARITTGSPNVTAEGTPAGRKTDPSTQNHANTVGNITQNNADANIKDLDAEKKKACSLVKADTKIKCKHGRENGPSGLLQVTQCDCKLHAKRINAKVANAAPECQDQGIHTEWDVKRKKGGKNDKNEEYKGKDDQDIEATEWLDKKERPDIKVTSPNTSKDDSSGVDAGQASRDKRNFELAKERNPDNSASTNKKIANAKTANETATKGVITLAQKGYDVAKAWEVWHADKEPLTLDITASACSGQANFKIESFPAQAVKVSFSNTDFRKIRAAINAIEKIWKGAAQLASMAGGKVDADLHFLEGCKIEFKVQWIELTKDYPEINKYKHHVDRDWSIKFSKDVVDVDTSTGRGMETSVGEAVGKARSNLAAAGFKFGMEIVAFVNVFLPSVGTIAAKVINWLGASATAGIDISFSVGIEAGFAHAAGEDAIAITGGLSSGFDVYINIKLEWGSSLEVSGGCFVKAEPTFVCEVPLKKTAVFDIGLKVEKGEVSFGFRGVFKVDTWWYKDTKAVDYVPEWAKVSYGPYSLKPLASFA